MGDDCGRRLGIFFGGVEVVLGLSSWPIFICPSDECVNAINPRGGVMAYIIYR